MKSLKQVLNLYVRPYINYLFLGAFFNILYSLFSIISIISLQPVLDILFGEENKKQILFDTAKSEASQGFIREIKYKIYLYLNETISIYGPLKFLAYLCIFSIFMFFLKNVSRYLAQCFIITMRTNTGRDLRIALYNKIISLPVAYFTDRKKGDIMTRISSDVTEVENTLLSSISEIMRTPFAIIFTIITLFYISPGLTLASLLVLPIMAWIISSIGKSLKKQARQGLQESANILSQVDESINGAKVIKVFNAENSLKNRFKNTAERLKKMAARVAQKYELASPTSEFLGSITMVSITWIGGYYILTNRGLEPTQFLIFIGLFYQLLEPAKTLSNSISNLHKGSASTDRIMEVLSTEEEAGGKASKSLVIKELKEGIEFKNVSFSYDQQIVLNDINLIIPKGKTIALVGQSGSGKTTIANLLARFYEVRIGDITIDGNSLKDFNIYDYRKLLGMVTQKSVLFNDTIINNIRLSKPEATLEEVIEAARIANALEFIEKLPNQFDELIGEGGDKLSGGQQQRICIARAILKNPPIMILDEATSALDTQSERLVQQALDNLMSNRTSVVIAHRLSTIQNADKIIVMDQGRIIEEGTHEELIQKGGMYKHLIDMQNFT